MSNAVDIEGEGEGEGESEDEDEGEGELKGDEDIIFCDFTVDDDRDELY